MRTLLNMTAAAAVGIMLVSGPAFAQSNSTSSADLTSSTQSGAESQSISNPHVNSSVSSRNSTSVVVNNGTSGAADPAGDPSSGSGDPTIKYEGGYTVNNVPEVIPPSVIGGNACAVGASGGLAVAGLGISAGATWADKACERRQQAALLYNMGLHANNPGLLSASYALIAQDPHVAEAMHAAGLNEIGQPVQPARSIPPGEPIVGTGQVVHPTPVVVIHPASWCGGATDTTAHLKTLSEGQRAYIIKNCGSPH